MNIQEFFDSPVMQLPRNRDDENFERYLANLFEAYIRAIKALGPHCDLCSRIRGAEGEIIQLSECIQDAVRHYLDGTPAAAYKELLNGVNFVYPRLQKLLSREVGSGDIGKLYRIRDTKGKTVPKERLFHAPFNLRHKVGQHRYGIPGFPCLYLGGSLELCIEECGIQTATLPGVSVAEFVFRNKVKILDFGFRPSALARVAVGIAMHSLGANPPLEQFIINYTTCWPLIAASSIKVFHGGEPFVYEYIIPQMILQWIMSNDKCDGIRYFSTRFTPYPDAVYITANYVFPATHDSGPQTGYSQRLKDAFEFTDPIVWGAVKTANLTVEARNKEHELNALSKAPIA
jgi:hypothetical protein